VRVAPQCSGFEGIGLTCVFTLAYLGVFRRELRFPQALLLPVIGLLAVWLINVLRLAGLVLLGSSGHEELAAGGFHSVAGTLAFCAVALGLVALSRRLPFFWRAGAHVDDAAAEEGDATAAHLVPFLFAVAAGMVVHAFADSAARLEALRTCVVAAALLFFLRDYDLRLGRNLVSSVVLGLVAAGVWIALPTPGGVSAAPELGDLGAGGWNGLTLALRSIGYVVVFPLAEELAFRGYLMRRLTSANWQQVSPAIISPLAWIVSTLIFGLLHEHWIAATLAGAMYGIAFARRGSLGAAVVAHGATNAVLAACALLGFPGRPSI
jgi:exosortase E/protease (VPEID-CTERM system)